MFILDILFEQQLNSWSRGDGVRQRRWIRARGDAEEGEGAWGGVGACSSQHARLQAPGSVRSPQTRTAPTLMRQSLSGTCGSSAWQLCSSSSAPQVTDTRAYTGAKHHFGGFIVRVCVCCFFLHTVCCCLWSRVKTQRRFFFGVQQVSDFNSS